MYIVLVAVWWVVASQNEGYPSPISTYQVAFGGIDKHGEEIQSVLANGFYIGEDEEQGVFWHLLDSLAYLFGGFALVLFIGLPLGLLVGLSPTFKYGYDVITGSLKAIAPIVWLPFVLILVQDTVLVALITIYLAALWPLVSSTAFGVKMIHQDYLKMSKTLQLTRRELLVDIILPLIVPYIFDGIRRSLWIAWVTIIPIEMLLEDKGLGHWVWNAYNEEMQEQIIIGMVLIYILGSTIGYVLKLIADYFNYMD